MPANPQFPADLSTFTEEIFNGKPHFLKSDFEQYLGTGQISIPKYGMAVCNEYPKKVKN